MGFFKKIIRKVTKPVSKVLDKIVPNEIKPLLPYAAAFAPYLLPAGAGAGIMGSMGINNPMLQRALLSGGANVFSQLSQEGNEGDLNLLSAGLGALQGAMTAQGANTAFRDAKFGSSYVPDGSGFAKNVSRVIDTDNLNMFQKAANIGLEGLAKGSEFAGKAKNVLANPGFNMETMKASAIPFSMGTGEAMAFEANAAMKEYERALADYNLEQGALGTDAGRREAILTAMRAYNHPEELIESTLAELGLRNGGRVGLAFGGIPAAVQNVADKQLTSNLETAQDMQIPMEELVQEFIELKGRKPNDYDELLDYYRQKYGTGSQISSMTEKMTEEFAANGGMMGRKPFVSGGIGKGIMKMFSRGDDAVDVQKQFEQFREGPITAKFLEDVDQGVANKFIRTRDTGGVGGYGMYNNFAEMPAGLQAAELINRIKNADGSINYEAAEVFIGKKLKGNETIDELIAMIVKPQRVQKAADGGIMEYNMGGSVLPDGIEMDYRGGGFIPMGSKERADDVPARVSKNEFVMTADAVRAAGGGSVNEGAKRMYELMNTLEARA
jgi:hypothetical protein